MPDTPQQLAEKSKCLRCIPKGALGSVLLWLLVRLVAKKKVVTEPFSYEPASSRVLWQDKNGLFIGDLAQFNSSADIASVSRVEAADSDWTSVSHLESLPALVAVSLINCSLITSVDVTGNPILNTLILNGTSITSLDLSQNSNLYWLDIGSCPVTPIDLSHNVNLVILLANVGYLTTVDISNNPHLINIQISNQKLTVLAVNKILVQLVTNGLLNGNVDTSSQTPAAAPTHGPPDGINAKQTLSVGRGWTVSTD